jgi:hypothetical protein
LSDFADEREHYAAPEFFRGKILRPRGFIHAANAPPNVGKVVEVAAHLVSSAISMS